MYNASNAFHQAVANGAHQIALLIFGDAVFTNDDIDVERGIDFNDYFCTDEDLSIGAALSNELSFSLFNDTGLLDDYEFGDFTATIGAQTGSDIVTANGIIQAESGSHTYVAYETYPFLRRDGNAVSSQPEGKLKSILIYNGLVYCLTANGNVKVYKDSSGSAQSVTIEDPLKTQMSRWEGKGLFYSISSRILKVWEGTNLRTYEFVPLGVFCAERPNVPSVIAIDFDCNDQMIKFDVDMPGASALGISYPCTISNLFVKMCDYLDVSYATSTFINSTATITKEPEEFKSATMRDVLGWIAEAAASVARFNRDGVLIFDWLRSTQQSYDEGMYSEFKPYWYRTKQISKLYNRASNGAYEHTKGTGNEAYLIQDNPLLQGVS